MTARGIEPIHDLVARGQLQAAQAQLTRLLAKPPLNVDAAMLMSVVATSMGEPARGAYWAERCIAAMPNEPGAHANLVSALISQNKTEEAVRAAERAREALPQSSTAAVLLPMVLNVAKRRMAAYRALREAIDRFPNEERLYASVVSVMLGVGRSDEALDYARRGVSRWPDNPRLASDLIRALAYAQDHTGGVAQALAHFQRALALGVGAPNARWDVDPDPERRLNIGILSGDLRGHAVMFFAQPLFDHVDRERFRLHCYSTTTSEDEFTAHVRTRVSTFRRVPTANPVHLASQIITDKIDILLDFSGHTPGEMLATLHLKPAPMIAHWIAFPGSIGLVAMDYRITDDACDPFSDAPLGPEKLLRIDQCYVPFVPCRPCPEPVLGPLEKSGFITFGSISSMMKVTQAGLELWARVVQAVPNSHFYFKSHWLDDDELRADILSRFAAAGMPLDRLTLDGPSPGAPATMACYANFDISLDTYPYHGMTTTCESTWMGVPMVALAGKTTASRVNCSLLRALGLSELVAQTPDEFVRIASRLASDAPRLRTWRSLGPGGLRAQMAASPIRDEPGFVRKLEAALRGCWREYCARATR
jgi:predicted O-linked N-acetylglucosamine transferase (SPINDLY family)